MGTHTIRVSNTTKCSEVETISKTACGFVLEFADIVTRAKMNENHNYYGWMDSDMRTYQNETLYNAIPEDLRSGIIDTFVVSSYSLNGKWGYSESGNYETTDKIYLLSPAEVYGLTFSLGYESSYGTSRQLDWYSKEGVRFNGYTSEIKYDGEDSVWWWLRSARNDNENMFFGVGIYGEGVSNPANTDNGVSPAFRLSH